MLALTAVLAVIATLTIVVELDQIRIELTRARRERA